MLARARVRLSGHPKERRARLAVDVAKTVVNEVLRAKQIACGS
jgi:hypothetical protein